MHCGDEAEALQAQHPSAFLLLCQIARRAKWKDCRITKMKKGEALIGDWKEAGIKSEMAYRIAKQTLADCGLATFQGTNKGTRAILTSTTIFSLTKPLNNEQEDERGNDPTANKERSNNDPTTTNHTDTRDTQSTQTHPEGEAHKPAMRPKKTPPEVSTEGIKFALWFKSTLPESVRLKSDWQESFAKAHDDIVRLDKRTSEEIRQVCEWARTDQFWQSQFMSPAKLRKRNGDGITYFDFFIQQMKPHSQGGSTVRLKSKFAGTPQPELQMPT
jgi:hypothetical protein